MDFVHCETFISTYPFISDCQDLFHIFKINNSWKRNIVLQPKKVGHRSWPNGGIRPRKSLINFNPGCLQQNVGHTWWKFNKKCGTALKLYSLWHERTLHFQAQYSFSVSHNIKRQVLETMGATGEMYTEKLITRLAWNRIQAFHVA